MRDARDVLIIGGGPAGLSAALALGRCRRRVLVCDKGEPRNAASKAMHGFLTRDGIDPREFLRIAREQLSTYPNVEFRGCEIVRVERADRHFIVHTHDGSPHTARVLLFATGLVDEIPPLPGIDQFYGRSVHHCPYCDGWEHQDQRLAVFGHSRDAVDLAIELLVWSKRLVLCSHGTLAADDAGKLAHFGIPVVITRIDRLEGDADTLRAIVFRDGARLECDALFFAPAQHPRCDLATRLGCKLDKSGQIECDDTQMTCIDGVFVVGNAAPGLQLVIMAAAEGTKAGFAIHHALQQADLAGDDP